MYLAVARTNSRADFQCNKKSEKKSWGEIRRDFLTTEDTESTEQERATTGIARHDIIVRRDAFEKRGMRSFVTTENTIEKLGTL
jgi:hypothetical protein